MACMEHECETCGYVYFDNRRYGCCPRCGGATIDHFDEDIDKDEEIDKEV